MMKSMMQLEGIHHITAITGDAPRNVSFYVGTLGMRLVKKTVNQDDPTVYHLFYGDEQGSPGFDLTFFEYPGALPGQAGSGMIHQIDWRVGSNEAIDFWERRLADRDVATERLENRLRFGDPEGLSHQLLIADVPDAPLTAKAEGIPSEFAIQGFDGVRAYSARPEASAELLTETLGFRRTGDSDREWEIRGERRGGRYVYDEPPAERGNQGGGTVHHIAFATEVEEQEAWQERVSTAGMHATPVIDRFYFRSVYFREPSGVLFELATMGPGFATDEDPDKLGERLSLPPNFEHLREQLEATLTPLT